MIKQLIKLANHLDNKRLVTEADYLDNVIKKYAGSGPVSEGFYKNLQAYIGGEIIRGPAVGGDNRWGLGLRLGELVIKGSWNTTIGDEVYVEAEVDGDNVYWEDYSEGAADGLYPFLDIVEDLLADEKTALYIKYGDSPTEVSQEDFQKLLSDREKYEEEYKEWAETGRHEGMEYPKQYSNITGIERGRDTGQPLPEHHKSLDD